MALRTRSVTVTPLIRLLFGSSPAREWLHSHARKCGVEPALLEDPHAWLPARFYYGLFERIADSEADPHGAVYRAGLQSLSRENIGSLYVQARALGTPRSAYSRYPDYLNSLQTIGRYETRAVSHGAATICFTPCGETPHRDLDCTYRRGALAAIPTLWDLPVARTSSDSCLARGDSSCTYRISWVPMRRRALAWAAGAGGLLFGSALWSGLVLSGSIPPELLPAAALLAPWPLLGFLAGRGRLQGAQMRDSSELTTEQIGALESELRNIWDKCEVAEALQKLTDAIFQSMTNAVALLESDGRVTRCNPAFAETFSARAGSRLGELDLAPVLEATSPRPFELQTGRGLFLVSTRPLEAAGGAGVDTGADGLRVAVLADITELRQLQEVDRRRKALAELGATISSINHEIGNIVSPLNHYIARARRTAAPGEVGECLDAAAERLRMLQSLSGELREYYREPVLSPRRVPLAELVESALADVRSGAGERWVAPRLENLDFEITADLQKMKQVFLNLAKNAWEAMSEIECPEWAVTAEHTDGLARISVSDSGPGIPPGKLERLFEPFYTTKKERGTGLGLAIARRIVEAHGATVNVESETGRGTTVTITWPRG